LVAVEVVLPPDTESPRRARSVVRAALDGEANGVTDMALLLVSEVVTNAVLHARSEIQLRVGWNGEAIRVEVVDHSHAMPATRQFSELATTGRGMQLVDQVATTWGSDRREDGKVVWFELIAS
jgi:anti-sigma regulatory factor (Ser/Thr protein kinase)